MDQRRIRAQAHKYDVIPGDGRSRPPAIRTLVSKGFTPRRIRELEPRVTAIAVQHLDAALQSDSFDYVDEFAGKLPMDVDLRTDGRSPT